MKVTNETHTAAIKTLQEYFKSGKQYPFVLLFGSFASGEAAPSSDVDLGIYVGKEPDFLEMGRHISTLESLLQRRVDLTLLDDLEARNPLLAFEILNQHIPLLIRDNERYIAFKTRAQLAYLDARPLIEANREALQKRIEANRIGERNFATTY
ncbi:type VII toxin-antitoxin system MntA family adenylyltransferase antitoxin [Nitratifractor salsuginis]|uniref:DNA polymerase beta domain protein region n=1 Tax=Nitratifractor salsuginis (strain DSM 16511 / JCM 12458 / E9I37-1) TaxID=749222 RepID=E6X2P5_NITSE|nr:nucleotidyltransferase domain-containing protein [Nitratifractor salsuginis]ADV46111.1 DNA polymerase beta domain protein region [Nitratifractor salsuginis DSM 16511]